MWRRQYVKELMAHRGDTSLILGAVLVWYVFLQTRVGVWPAELVSGLSWIPAGFLPIWALWTSVQLYRQEWRENTSYLMLSLPVPARVITSAKLAALLTGVLLYAAVILSGGMYFMMRSGILTDVAGALSRVGYTWIIWPLTLLVISLLLGFVLVVLIAQVAFVFSRFFNRFQGLVMAWTWVVGIWFTIRFVGLVGPLLAWMPDFHFRVLNESPGFMRFDTVTFESGGFWALVLLAAGLFALLNLSLERAVEV